MKRKDNGKYVESLALGKGIGLIAETTASLQENAYKLNSKDQADAVAVLIDGTVGKYVESLALGKGIGLIAETTASLQENAYKLNSKDQADAVAVLIDGTVEKV